MDLVPKTVAAKNVRRWRLLLGATVEEELREASGGFNGLQSQDQQMDAALAALYDQTSAFNDTTPRRGSKRSAGLGKSAPMLARWLGDIREFFPQEVVAVIQNDAIERQGLRELLLQPEVLQTVEPNVGMVATLVSLKNMIPEKGKETARQLVRAVVDQITRRLESDLRRAITGVVNRRQHSPLPSIAALDWQGTIRKNLQNYDPQSKRLIPERFYFFDRQRRQNRWHIILDMDQSGSMASSVIYGSIAGAIFASMPALETHVVAFDTEVVDLSEACRNDPVDLLFGLQLGGGTDINKSLGYCRQLITEPGKTIFILLSDLYENGNQTEMLLKMEEMKASGVKVICLLALDDAGRPSYHEGLAGKLGQMGIPSFACTPNLLPDLLVGALKGVDLMTLAASIKEQLRTKR